MTDRFIGFAFGRVQSGEVTNHPLAVKLLPIKWRLPVFAIDRCPAFGKPPAKVLITTVADKREIVAVRDGRAIKRVVHEENLVRGLFVVESEVVVSNALPDGRATAPIWTLDFGLWTLDLAGVAKPEQSARDFRHAFNFHRRGRCGFDWRVVLIAEQVFDVVNQQLLMLHLVFESEPDERQDITRLRFLVA